jgi:hypothetical protein
MYLQLAEFIPNNHTRYMQYRFASLWPTCYNMSLSG